MTRRRKALGEMVVRHCRRWVFKALITIIDFLNDFLCPLCVHYKNDEYIYSFECIYKLKEPWLLWIVTYNSWMGSPGGLVSKKSACNAGDYLQCTRPKFDPWFGKIFWEGNGNQLQYSCLGNPMDRGAWWGRIYGVSRVEYNL